MDPRHHFVDLRRRYQEADWVSEFQRLWAVFNHWLVAQFGNTQDRACIEHLKTEAKLSLWIDGVIQASTYNQPHRTSDGYGGSYRRFVADNEISRFFRAIAASPVIEPRINRPWRTGSDLKVRITNAIILDVVQFRLAYEAHARLLDEFMTFDLTIHQTLPAIGVHTTGCCFYRDAADTSLPAGTEACASRLVDLFRESPSLTELVHLIESQEPTDLASDVIETLYNTRNVAVHGSLDFLNEEDNAAARAAYDLLDSLIRDIRDQW